MVDWKKEVKLSDLVKREPKAPKPPKEAKAPKQAKQPKAETTPFWKKEVSFGRKQKDAVAPEPAAEPVEELLGEELSDDALAAFAPVDEPWDAPAELPVEPEPVPPPAAPPVQPPAAPPVQPPAAPPVQPVALPTPPPAVAAAAPVVHPPVPAAELPPLGDAEKEEAKPFYKRELSFGRKPKAEKPEKAPKKERAPKEKRQKADKAARDPNAPEATKGEKAPRAKREKGAARRQKKLVGLKIGASQLAAARVSNNGHAEVLQLVRQPLEPGVVAGGELRDPEALAAALKLFFKQHKLPKRGVRLGIANNRIGVRTFEITGIDDPKQLANAIRFRAQEALPIPIEEAVLDYQILAESVDAEGQKTRRILLVVAYRELVDRYVSACRKAGLNLVGIDLEAFALLRALAAPREEGVTADSALVAVTIGHERSTFAVSDGRTCEFTRVLDWGGAALSVAIARTLDMAPSEVEPIKLQLSLLDEEVPEGITAEQATAARDAVRRQIQTFARELVSSLQFYQGQPGSLGIGGIVITGGTAHLPGLAQELERLIGVRVEIGDPLVRVKTGKKVRDDEQLGSFAVAIGLGIED